jgi:hypothetical protein
MKPFRTYPLVIEIPRSKGRDTEEEAQPSVVVLRPIVAGSQVQPVEQRFVPAAGNQVVFHITPVSRGRLPRARLEVFAPSQAPESIPLYMKAKTQRLTWLLLLLALLVPTVMLKVTRGTWNPGKDLAGNLKEPLVNNLPPIPILNQRTDILGSTFKDSSVTELIGDGLILGWTELNKVVTDHRWIPATVGFGFVVLAFFSWLFHRPARKRLIRRLDLDLAPLAPNEADVATLQPI